MRASCISEDSLESIFERGEWGYPASSFTGISMVNRVPEGSRKVVLGGIVILLEERRVPDVVPVKI